MSTIAEWSWLWTGTFAFNSHLSLYSCINLASHIISLSLCFIFKMGTIKCVVSFSCGWLHAWVTWQVNCTEYLVLSAPGYLYCPGVGHPWESVYLYSPWKWQIMKNPWFNLSLKEDESMEKYSLPVLISWEKSLWGSLEGPSETEWSTAGPSQECSLD